MSEFAFYWFMNEKADIEELERIDAMGWPASFEEYMETVGYDIQKNAGFSDESLHESWRLGVWQDGFVHALLKQRRGDEEPLKTWWNRDYEGENRYLVE